MSECRNFQLPYECDEYASATKLQSHDIDESISRAGSCGTTLLADNCPATQIALKQIIGSKALFAASAKDEPDFRTAIGAVDYSSVEAVLINAHLNLFGRTDRAECLGLRVFDEILLHLRSMCVPMLLYSPLTAQQMERWCEQSIFSNSTPWLDLVSRLADAGSRIDKIVVQTPTDWRRAIAKCKNHWKTIDLAKLLTSTSRAYVERTHANVRHRFDGLRRPPARLVLGLEMRPKAQADTQHVIDALTELARKQTEGPVSDSYLSPLRSTSYGQALELARYKVGSAAASKSWKVLLVDDAWDEAGWLLAFKAIFENWAIQGLSATADDLHTKDYDLVLLDYELSHSGTCASWLRRIKALYPEVPIVMLTMSDRADVALWCLQHGANAYFVKEPYEPTLRNSGEHLDRLLLVLESVNTTKAAGMLGMWSTNHYVRRFFDITYRTNWGAVLEAESSVRTFSDKSLSWHIAQLGRAVLANYEDFYLARGSTLDSDERLRAVALSRLAYNAEVSLEILAECWWQKYRHPDQSVHEAFRGLRGGWRTKWRFLIDNGYKKLPVQSHHLNKGGKELVAHWVAFLPQISIPSAASALELLQSTLFECVQKLPEAFANVPPIKPLLRSSIPQFQSPPEPVPSSEATRRISHAEHQILGAEELIRGFGQTCRCPPDKSDALQRQVNLWSRRRHVASDEELKSWIGQLSPNVASLEALRKQLQFPTDHLVRVLILDDQPWSAFVTVLRLLLLAVRKGNVLEVKADSPDSVCPSQPAVANYEMVLLDLDLGSSHRPRGDEQGLEWLARLRLDARDWGTPVAILSARIDSLSLRETFKRGAVDYIPKRVSGRNPEECLRYILGHVAFIARLTRDLRDLRKVEQSIRELWQTPLELGSGRIDLRRMAEALGQQPESTISIMDVQVAIEQALLSSWCYLYLNVTRKLRSDLWLDYLFSGANPDDVYLRQAVVDMGCAVEPLILLTRYVDRHLANNTSPVAGHVVTGAGGFYKFSQLLGSTLAETIRGYWDWRNKCEHGQPPPTTRECIRLLGKCVSTVKDYRSRISRVPGTAP
jgi:CheY-like chemotaxis protein